LIKSEVEEALDHKNLNEEVPVFATLNPSAENIAVVIHGWLRPHIDAALKLKVTLYETPRNYVEFSD
jgi:6-pyruvoyltetrahydropterin/6-carboxytetrahydropterin synthase